MSGISSGRSYCNKRARPGGRLNAKCVPCGMRPLFLSLLVAASAASAQSAAPKTLQVMWQAGGGDSDASLANISMIKVGPNGDVVVWDRTSSVLRLYNDAGKAVRVIGRTGSGPGEYKGISGMAYGADGRFYVWDSGNARLNAYKPNGDFEQQMRLPITSFSTNDGLFIDTQGRAWFRFVIFDRAGGKTTGAWIRMKTANGVTIDTVKFPELPGNDPQLVARNGGSMSSYSLPYGRVHTFALTAAGDIMTARGDKYEVGVPHRGRTVKIERAYKSIPVPGEERDQFKARLEKNLRQIQPDWSWPSTPIPSVKPAIQSVAGGLDGRVWVNLYTESEKYTPEAPPTADKNPLPPVTYRPANKKWDVFEPDGRYVGTVTASRNVDVRVMRGDFAWGISFDEDDVPTLVKLKVTPGFGKG